MSRPYTRGLHDLGNGLWAWLQPDGSWGWSNAGLVVGNNEAVLIDTFFDLARTDGLMPLVRATARFNRHRELVAALFRHRDARRILFRRFVENLFGNFQYVPTGVSSGRVATAISCVARFSASRVMPSEPWLQNTVICRPACSTQSGDTLLSPSCRAAPCS